ncbi:methyltransferase family protein [Actinocrispum wychmicini]|uniref:Methyltransferase family protein n=2 Tax=Actinocrispum wychmicini TaxID=1213861 RepID=A0A4R2J8Q4_9PSEU|nr:methyltransferase family protein [Actinocrispum wychmicini]
MGLLDLLRCPQCTTEFTFEHSPIQPLASGAFGVLRCGTHEYPVIDGIPVIRNGHVSVHDHTTLWTEVPGPTVDKLVDLVRSPDPLAALVELLAFPPALPWGLEHTPIVRLPLTRGPGQRMLIAARRREIRRLLNQPVSQHTAQDWMRLCYLRSRGTNPELYPYFLLRFGQPRMLAALALYSVLDSGPKPILDLACGFGHIMYLLAARPAPLWSIGVDRNFFQLWVARRWIATDCDFVCADAALRLPFADNSFAASVCSDAFHCLPDQQLAYDELRRCADNNTVLLDRVGNADIDPRDSPHERTLDGYLTLTGTTSTRILGEQELLTSYLTGQGPALATQRPLPELRQEKWLTLVSSDDPKLFRDHDKPTYLPHAQGQLAINPIYRPRPHGDHIQLRFMFPSDWYAFENATMRDYHPTQITLTHNEYQDLLAGRHTDHTDELTARFVLTGMPPRYAHPPAPHRNSTSRTPIAD